MHVIIYVRVSTDRQAEKALSLPAQLAACRQFAAQHGWQVLEEFIEPGVSARTADRPQLKRLLSRCRESTPKIGAVIVHKLDRLARNVADHSAIRALLAKHQVKLVSVTENLDDSVSGVLVENILAALAEFYSANLGEEVKKGMHQKVVQGGWPHMPPRGYRLVRDEAGRSSVEIHPTVGPIIARAFQLIASGALRPGAVRGYVARLGLVTKHGRWLEKNAALRILRNPFYCGRVHWKNEWFAGQHPALVSADVFDQVQRQLQKRRYQFRARQLLVGIASCAACGSLVTAERHGKHEYYRCRRNLRSVDRCRAPFINAARAHADLETAYGRITLTADRWRTIQRQLLQAAGVENRIDQQRQQGLRDELAFLEVRRQRLVEALANGLVAPEAYRFAVERLNQEEGAFEEALKRTHLAEAPLPQISTDGSLTIADLDRQLLPAQRHILARVVLEHAVLDQSGVAFVELAEFARAA